MTARLQKLPNLAEQIGKTPRWLRDHLRRHPIGRKAGRDIVFTEANVRCVIASLPFKVKPQTPAVIAPRMYFIRSGAHVKIGIAHNPNRRLAQLQIAHPEPLDLLFFMPGGGPEETRLHALFQAHRVRGEWFRLCREIEDWIASAKAEA